MPKNTTKTLRRDASRRITPKRTYYTEAFQTYARERVDELAGVDRSDPGIVAEIARAFNLRHATLDQFRRRRGWRQPALTDKQRAELEAWEAASRRLEPLRTLVAIVRDAPEADRSALEDLVGELDGATRDAARGAIDHYLMAGDLADRMREHLACATAAAMALLKQRTAAEPLIAFAEVEESAAPRTVRPLIDERNEGRSRRRDVLVVTAELDQLPSARRRTPADAVTPIAELELEPSAATPGAS